MNNIDTLRESLFATMEAVRNGTMSIEQANAVSDIGQVIINSAKVEVDFVKANNGGKSHFFENETKQISQTANGTVTREGASTVHKLRG